MVVVLQSNRKLLLWLPTHCIQSEFKLHIIPFYVFIFTFLSLHVYKQTAPPMGFLTNHVYTLTHKNQWLWPFTIDSLVTSLHCAQSWHCLHSSHYKVVHINHKLWLQNGTQTKFPRLKCEKKPKI
jgi:hypothetical protein